VKRFLFAGALALSLPGCAGLPFTSPVAVADRTTLDEQSLLALELAYKAARLAVETGVDAGLIRGELAKRVASLDNRAFAALKAARGAYRAGNSSDYSVALSEAQNTLTGLLALAEK
jgi:hypothetical protein